MAKALLWLVFLLLLQVNFHQRNIGTDDEILHVSYHCLKLQ